jgi:hypothetical protein
LAKFTNIRAQFENFLVEYKYFLNQIVRAYGSLQKSVSPILSMYTVIFNSLTDGNEDLVTIDLLQAHPALRSPIKVATADDRLHGRNFTTETKNSLVLKAALESAPRCEMCKARLHLRFMTVDHKTRKEDGGTGAPNNGQLTHPYCNSGYKESRHSSAIEA